MFVCGGCAGVRRTGARGRGVRAACGCAAWAGAQCRARECGSGARADATRTLHNVGHKECTVCALRRPTRIYKLKNKKHLPCAKQMLLLSTGALHLFAYVRKRRHFARRLRACALLRTRFRILSRVLLAVTLFALKACSHKAKRGSKDTSKCKATQRIRRLCKVARSVGVRSGFTSRSCA